MLAIIIKRATQTTLLDILKKHDDYIHISQITSAVNQEYK